MGLQVPFAPYLLVFFFCRYCNYLFRVTQTNKVDKTKQTKQEKKALYLSVNVFSMKVLTGDTIFYVS